MNTQTMEQFQVLDDKQLANFNGGASHYKPTVTNILDAAAKGAVQAGTACAAGGPWAIAACGLIGGIWGGYLHYELRH